ncbi:MFS transporter [Phytomonospora sp. NPDC050363]|uniref:MFS transporter n=1 Tax=Phytomonospora sp. NPDC050363 TaxID=3155642 RepID=UPI0033C13DF6
MTATLDSPRRHNGGVPGLDPKRWAGLAVLCASLLIVAMDMTILNVALPAISEQLKPGSVQLLWIVDIYPLVVAGLLVTASGLADKFGRKRMLMVGFATFALASMLVLVIDSAPGLIVVRSLLGVGGALIMPSTLSMIRNLFSDAKERAVALGIWGSMAAVGTGLGPIAGGALLEHFSWHSAFLVNVPVMAVALVAAWFVLPESFSPRSGRWDVLGTLLSVVGMVSLMLAIKNFGKHGVTDPVALIAIVVAVAALGWFVHRSLHRRDPLLDIRLLKRRALSAGLIAALTTSIALAAMLLLLAQWMQLVAGMSPLEAGVHLLPAAIAAGILSPLAPRIAAVIGARTVMAGGLAMGGLGFLALFVLPAPLSYATVALSLTFVGVGMASLAIGSAAVMSSSPAEKSGSAAALEETAFELGGALGVAILGSVAAIVYRAGLSLDDLAAMGVTGPEAEAARESLGGAVAVADQAGAAGLTAQAQESFTNALEIFGVAGGALMLIGALAVWLLTPKGMSVTGAH